MASRRRFIDAIVVVFVLALFTAAVVPAILAAREAARMRTCENNLKQIGLGLVNYADVYNVLPLGTSGSRDLSPAERFSWCPSIWHFIEGKPPRLLIDETQAWNSPVNRFPKVEFLVDWNEPTERKVIEPLPSLRTFHCPSAVRRDQIFGIEVTHYVGMAGVGLQSPEFDLDQPGVGVWGYDRRLRIDNVANASGTTISLIETSRNPGPWLAGGLSTVRGVDMEAKPYVGPGRQLGGIHSGCPVVMLDASVRQLSNDIDPNVLAAMIKVGSTE